MLLLMEWRLDGLWPISYKKENNFLCTGPLDSSDLHSPMQDHGPHTEDCELAIYVDVQLDPPQTRSPK